MKMLARLERLEAARPRMRQRVILVWIDREGRRTKVADTMPHLRDDTHYDKDATDRGEKS